MCNILMYYIISLSMYHIYNILKCGSKGTFQTFLNIVFLLRNHYFILDFRFLFGHHNSICDTGLNVSGRCLKAFLNSLATILKNLFPVYYIIHINIYST